MFIDSSLWTLNESLTAFRRKSYCVSMDREKNTFVLKYLNDLKW